MTTRTPKSTARWNAEMMEYHRDRMEEAMTSAENERLAKLEAGQDAMREDIGEIKVGVAQLVAAQATSGQRANDRHADLEARNAEMRASIEVLKEQVKTLKQQLYGAGIGAAAGIGGHVYNFVSNFGG